MKSYKDFISKEKGMFSKADNGFLPRHIFVPFNHGKLFKGNPVVKIGDSVLEGSVISICENGLKIHSSVPGVVTEILNMETVDGQQCLGAKINLSGKFSYFGKKNVKKEWELIAPSVLREEFNLKGISNTFYTFSKTRSLSVEIADAAQRKRNPIICVRLFDDDPSRLIESFVSEHYFSEVVEGCAIVAKASNAQSVIFIKDKNQNFELSDEMLKKFGSISECVKLISSDSSFYPCGLKNGLINTVKAMKFDDKLYDLNHKDLFLDSLTCLSSYNAIALDMPFVSQFVYVTGECLKSSVIMNIRFGTPISELIDQLGGFRRKVENVIINGFIRGIAVDSFDIPITKDVKSISFCSRKETSKTKSSNCVRCGKCRKACPQGLEPAYIFRTFVNNSGKTCSNAYIQSTLLCSECSLCNTVCPSRLPLSQTMALIKTKLKNGELNEE